MNFDRPSSSTLVRWTATALIVLVALPFLLYAVAQFAPGFGGYVVLSDSMAPEYRAGDVVFVRTVGAEAVEPGDVITYHAPDSKQQVTHQVVEVREQDGQPLFQTKGTANEEPDPYLVPPGALIGVVVFHIPYLGQAITFLQTDIGVALFVIVPLGLLVVTELWALVVAARSGTDEGGTGSESSAGATTADDGSTNAGDRSTDMDDATASGSASASADARMDGGGESRAGRTDGSLDESARSDGGGAEPMTGSATSGGSGSLVDRLRQPEYTGQNRCLPCTVVNATIALCVAAGIGGAAVAGGIAPPVAVGLAGLFVVVAAGSIYLRGYLVPYTPTLTKRYLPDRVLRWFDKAPGAASEAAGPGADGELVDIERTLDGLGVVTDCPDADDLCLDPSFRRAWHERIDAIGDRTPEEEAVARLLDLDDPARVDVQQFGNAAVVRVDGYQAGQWESDAAFVADVAADAVLRDRTDQWAELDVVNRSRVLNALRMFMERCPECGTPVTVGQEVVESCCRTMDVAAVSCDSCGSRVFEIELTDEMKAEL